MFFAPEVQNFFQHFGDVKWLKEMMRTKYFLKRYIYIYTHELKAYVHSAAEH